MCSEPMISSTLTSQEIGFQDHLGCSWLGANCHHTFGKLRRLEATYMQTEQEFNFFKACRSTTSLFWPAAKGISTHGSGGVGCIVDSR